MAKNNEEMSKHTLFLRSGDYEALRQAYPDIGAAVVIRRAVSKIVDSLSSDRPDIKVEVNL